MRATRPRDRRAHIEEAAERLFCAFGYHGVGVDAVAAEVGIGGSAIYRHFKGKRVLLYTVVMGALDRFIAALEEADRDAGSSEELLLQVATAVLEHRRAPLLWQRELRNLNQAEREEVQDKFRSLQRGFATAMSSRAPVDGPTVGRARAALSVMWSVSYHRANIPTADFVRLLAEQAGSVWHVSLPDQASSEDLYAEGGGGLGRVSQRERILTVASELFAERGWSEVRVDDIGAVLGVTGASVYQHFATKAEILQTALWRGNEALHLTLGGALNSTPDPDLALRRALISYVDIMVNHRGYTQLLITEVMSLPEESRAEVYRTQREYVSEWVHLVRSARPEVSANEGRALVQAALTVINDQFRAALNGDGTFSRDEIVALGIAALTPNMH